MSSGAKYHTWISAWNSLIDRGILRNCLFYSGFEKCLEEARLFLIGKKKKKKDENVSFLKFESLPSQRAIKSFLWEVHPLGDQRERGECGFSSYRALTWMLGEWMMRQEDFAFSVFLPYIFLLFSPSLPQLFFPASVCFPLPVHCL